MTRRGWVWMTALMLTAGAIRGRAPAPAAAEPAPVRRLPVTFDVLIRDALLVVHGRAEKVGGRVLVRIQDVWRGTYTPEAFERKPPEGFVDVSASLDVLTPGTECVVYWNRLNQVRGGLRQFTLVPVKDGKLSRSINRWGDPEELTLAQLKDRVKAR